MVQQMVVLILLVVSGLLVFRLRVSFVLEFLLMLLFLIISIIILAGVYKNKNWAWKLATIYFLVYLINAFYLYIVAINISSRFIGFKMNLRI